MSTHLFAAALTPFGDDEALALRHVPRYVDFLRTLCAVW